MNSHQGKTTFHKLPDYLLNSDKRATNCVVNTSVNFSLVRPGLESRLSHLDLWPQMHELLTLPPVRVATLGLLWGFNEIMSVTCSAHGLAHSKRSSNNNAHTNKNRSHCDDIIMVVAEVEKRYCPYCTSLSSNHCLPSLELLKENIWSMLIPLPYDGCLWCTNESLLSTVDETWLYKIWSLHWDAHNVVGQIEM